LAGLPGIGHRLVRGVPALVNDIVGLPEWALFGMIAFASAVMISLVVVGIPAAMCKRSAGRLFAANQTDVVPSSIRWGALVGIATILIHFAIALGSPTFPAVRGAVQSLGGWLWTAIGFSLLAAMAVAVDYWKVVRPAATLIPPSKAIGFLVLSNIWVLEGAILLAVFNANLWFPSCFDEATNRMVSTFYHERPETCVNL
jgi:hypothetical protein